MQLLLASCGIVTPRFIQPIIALGMLAAGLVQCAVAV
jgi:hypothetical protein